MDLYESRTAAPMLIARMQKPFDSKEWLYELKLDGFRCLAYLENSGVDLRNKRNISVLSKFPELGSIHACVKDRCILDGEVVVMRRGVPDFYEVQRRTLLTDKFKIEMAAKRYPASFVAYDCLYRGSSDILTEALEKRKEILSALVAEEIPGFAVSRYIVGQGTTLYKMADEQKLEGVIAKRIKSLYYMEKRTKDWVKFKRLADEDFIVAGFIQKGEKTYSIILAKYKNGQLVYKGHVTSGVTRHSLDSLAANGRNPFNAIPLGSGNRGAVWVVPDHVCVVEYMPNTKNSLRQPVFKGYRNDVLPEEVWAN